MTGSAMIAAALAALVLVSGCTSSPPDPAANRPAPASSAASGAPGTPTTSSTPAPSTARSAPATPARAPAAPRDGACYRLRFDQLTEPSNGSRPVPCSSRHDAETIHVGRLDTVVAGHAVSVDSDRVLRQLSRECPRHFADHVGGSVEDRRLSRLAVVWFAPTLAQGDRGADWFRCDVVALAGGEDLLTLPAPRRLAKVLDRPGGAAYGLCGTASPGDPAFARVICARRHSWRAVATIPLADARTYPGQRSVRRAGEQTCRDRVGADAEDPLKFEYGWEWPTRQQWQRGQHYGFCWAPD